MNPTLKLKQTIGATLLLLWGGVVLYFYASGRIANYLTPDFRTQALIAGVLLLVLGAFNLMTLTVKESCNHEHDHGHHHEDGECCGHDHDHDHGHSHDEAPHIHGDQPLPRFFFMALILLAPMSYAAFRTPDNYSSRAFENKGLYDQNLQAPTSAAEKYDLKKESAATAKAAAKNNPSPATPATAGTKPAVAGFSLKDLELQVEKSPEGNFKLEVPEIFLSTIDKEVKAVVNGLGVETMGQILPEKVNNPNGTRLRIMRLFVQCCAADASPMSFPLEFGDKDKMPKYQERGWYKVIGKIGYKYEGGVTVPIINVQRMEETSPPKDSMVY